MVRAADGSGPPPWVPFGKMINNKVYDDGRNFKALKDVESKDKDGEFENQRKQAVQELAKEAGSKVIYFFALTIVIEYKEIFI